MSVVPPTLVQKLHAQSADVWSGQLLSSYELGY